MLNLYLQLSERVSMILVQEKRIIFYKEYDYVKDILDIIYKILNKIKPNRVIVNIAPHCYFVETSSTPKTVDIIMDTYSNSNSRYLACYSFSALEKLNSTFHSAGVNNIDYYNKLTLIKHLASTDTCIITSLHGVIYLMALHNDEIVDMTSCSKDFLVKTVVMFCKKNNLKMCLDIDASYYNDALLYFSNCSDINDLRCKNALTFLSLIMQDSSLQPVSFDELVKTKNMQDTKCESTTFSNVSDLNSVNEADESFTCPEEDLNIVNNDDLLTESTTVNINKRKNKKTLKNVPHDNNAYKEKPNLAAPIIAVVLTVLFIGCTALTNRMLLTKSESIQELGQRARNTYDSTTKYKSYAEIQPITQLIAGIESIKESDCVINTLLIEDGVCHTELAFANKNLGESFLKEINENYEVINAEINGNDAATVLDSESNTSNTEKIEDIQSTESNDTEQLNDSDTTGCLLSISFRSK